MYITETDIKIDPEIPDLITAKITGRISTAEFHQLRAITDLGEPLSIERTPAAMVAAFHRTFGQAIRDRASVDVPEATLRVDLINEEAKEFEDAIAAGDVVAAADALGDLIYVIEGAALTFGIPLGPVLAEIHRSNMSKLGPDGAPIRRGDGKILKGPNYTPPDIARVLEESRR